MPPAKGKGAKKDTSSLKPVDDKKVGKRKAASKPVGKKEVAKKDPNKPKRPPSAFFIFLEDFRKTFKKENPNVKAVSAVGKAGGEKWKSMSQAEKAPYEAKAAKRKTEYGKLMDTYNKKQEADEDEEEEEEEEEEKEKEKEKSKPEVHGDDDDESAEDDDDDEEDDDDDDDEDED